MSVDPLMEAGWRPGRDAGETALLAILATVTVAAAEPFPAAERAVREFHGLCVRPAADGGREVAASGCVVDPRAARTAVPELRLLAEALGVRLFPFGRTDCDAPLVVDEEGHLLMLGTGGPWLLGETVHAGLTALTSGTAKPVRLRAPAWRIPLPAVTDDVPAALVRAALVAVYVLHARGVYDARALWLRATTLRGVGAVVVDEEFRFGPGRLEDSAESLTQAMTRRLAETGAGASGRGCLLTLAVVAPPAATGPAAGVECVLTAGEPATPPALTLSAGPAAVFNPTAERLRACAEALEAWAGVRV